MRGGRVRAAALVIAPPDREPSWALASSLPWDSRQALLAELRRDGTLRPTVVAFEAVGATRPVEIPAAQVGLLVTALISSAALTVRVSAVPGLR